MDKLFVIVVNKNDPLVT